MKWHLLELPLNILEIPLKLPWNPNIPWNFMVTVLKHPINVLEISLKRLWNFLKKLFKPLWNTLEKHLKLGQNIPQKSFKYLWNFLKTNLKLSPTWGSVHIFNQIWPNYRSKFANILLFLKGDTKFSTQKVLPCSLFGGWGCTLEDSARHDTLPYDIPNSLQTPKKLKEEEGTDEQTEKQTNWMRISLLELLFAAKKQQKASPLPPTLIALLMNSS